MLNEILAKLNQNEKLVGGGAAVAVVGWVLGLVLTSGWYDHSGAMMTGLIALIASIAIIVVLYLKFAPNSSVQWPAPVVLILFGLAVAAAIFALLGLVQALTYDPLGGLGQYCTALGQNLCPSKPITLYLVVLVVAGGAAAAAYGSYMEWVAAGKPTK